VAKQRITNKLKIPVGMRYDRVCARVSVCAQIKHPVSRRKRELGNQL
jgi:hypothetical protein